MNSKTNSKKKTLYITGIIFILLLLILFTLIAFNIDHPFIIKIDTKAHNIILGIRNKWVTFIFKIITNLCNPIVIGIISVIILFYMKNKKDYTFALFLNIGITALLNLVLKSFFGRTRPASTQSLIVEQGYSFPSGHAMFAIAFYGFLIFLLWKSATKKSLKITFTTLISILILAICFSRIYLGVHYTSDVIGGVCVSLSYIIIYLFVVNRNSKNLDIDKATDYKRHTFFGGFRYAFRGIITTLKEENNLLVQFCASMLVIVFSVFLRISPVEWCILLILCFLVMALEMVNTAIENICDKMTLENDNAIMRIKDIAAGAVLTMSICSVIVALTIFLPKLEMLFI